MQRLLVTALIPFLLATAVGLVLLWPQGKNLDIQTGFPAKELKASVAGVESKVCPDIPGQENFTCQHVTVRIEEGEDAGDTFSF
ncbi:MAG: hypothetical protein QOH90_65, partial [Actinomycetota bacterium]|nr:hypothetical protein [Actinomycetota bacterium]